MAWEQLSGYHDCTLRGLEPDSAGNSLTLRLETEGSDTGAGAPKALRVNGVLQLRAEGLRMQNVVSSLTLWTGPDTAPPEQALTWIYGLAEGGLLCTEDQRAAHLQSLRDGKTRMLWLDPSWGAELGVHFAGDLDRL